MEEEREPGGLEEGEGNGEVTGPLGDDLAPRLPLVLERLEPRDHHGEELHDDRRRDVRHDPEREHRQLLERPAGEEVEDPDEPALGRLVGKLLHPVEVDAGHRDRSPQPVDTEDEEGEEDLVPEVPDPEHVAEDGQHEVVTSSGFRRR